MGNRQSIVMSLVILICMLLTACGSKVSQTGTENSAPDNSVALSDTGSEEIKPDLPDVTLDGYNFVFGVRGLEGLEDYWDVYDLTAGEINGEPLNDAIYERTKTIEEKYDVTISVVPQGEMDQNAAGSESYKNITKSIMAGDNDFDALVIGAYDSANLACAGYLLDLSTVPHIDLEKPWWDQRSNTQLKFNEKLYFTTGDITTIDNKATHAVVFSKNVIKNFNLESPYDLVRSGSWTIDKLIEMSDVVSTDLNGDSVIDENDSFGYIYKQDSIFGMLHSCGVFFGQNTKDGITLSLNSDKTLTLWNKLIDFAKSDATISLTTDRVLYKDLSEQQFVGRYFESGSALFAFTYVGYMEQYRQVVADFGIIPLPKYDETQSEYNVTAHGYGTAFVSVPISNTSLDTTGIILEAFSAESRHTVTPAFYDINLVAKSSRDEESGEMLDLIFASKVYDIGYYYMWGDLTNKVMTAWNQQDPDFSSLYASCEERAKADLESTIQSFTDIN